MKLLDRLADLNWGLSRALISDRDRKFVAKLWKQIFVALKVDLLYSTAWHPQTDGASERSNQTAEIALRYYIASLEDPRTWPTILPRMSAALNNSIKYSSTVRAPTQVLYGFRTREALDLLRIEDPDAVASRPVENRTTSLPAGMMATTAYPAVIRNAARNNADVRRIPSSRVVISIRQEISFDDAVRTQAEIPLLSAPIPEIPDREERTSRQEAQERTAAVMDEYRPSHIDAKDAIAFASLKMKEYYGDRH